jgi:hypothetical protein
MRRLATACWLALFLLLAAAPAPPAAAYPEMEAWVETHSGRSVDCAMCHTHPDGPEGVKAGQIRSLDAEELARLNQARAAFEPGMGVDSPILNDFGDRILNDVGKRRFLEIRATNPGLLVAALGEEGDLDGDGIPDATEYAEGTDPLDPQHGDPVRLLRHNLVRHWFDLLMIGLATACGLYGLNHLLEWAHRAVNRDAVETSPPRGGGVIP